MAAILSQSQILLRAPLNIKGFMQNSTLSYAQGVSTGHTIVLVFYKAQWSNLAMDTQ